MNITFTSLLFSLLSIALINVKVNNENDNEVQSTSSLLTQVMDDKMLPTIVIENDIPNDDELSILSPMTLGRIEQERSSD